MKRKRGVEKWILHKKRKIDQEIVVNEIENIFPKSVFTDNIPLVSGKNPENEIYTSVHLLRGEETYLKSIIDEFSSMKDPKRRICCIYLSGSLRKLYMGVIAPSFICSTVREIENYVFQRNGSQLTKKGTKKQYDFSIVYLERILRDRNLSISLTNHSQRDEIKRNVKEKLDPIMEMADKLYESEKRNNGRLNTSPIMLTETGDILRLSKGLMKEE